MNTMSYTGAYFAALGVLAVLGCIAWAYSLVRKDVSFVDSLWSLFFLVAAGVFAASAESIGFRGMLVLALVAVWALRLSLHITVRNHGQGEDMRYQAIRARRQPNFEFKSLYLVFGLQLVLAWIIAIPLLFAVRGDSAPGIFDALGVLLWIVGFVFEAGGDYQLTRFKANPDSAGKVMDQGFWRYTRHPNYFGDACVWWGFYLMSLSAGGWWTIYAPVLMTLLLLKVSGVAMLERTIGKRRPAYQEYIETTNAFIPGLPKTKGAD